MTADEFRADFLESVKIDALESGEGSTATFVADVADCLQAADVLAEYSPCFAERRSKTRRLCRADAYHFDEADGTLTLIVADYDGFERRTLDSGKANRLLAKAVTFLESVREQSLGPDDFDFSDPAFVLVDIIREEWESVRRIRILLFTDADIGPRQRSPKNQELDGKRVYREIWDLNRLYDVAGSSRPRDPIVIDFTQYLKGTPGLPCVAAPQTASPFRSYLCIVPGTLLADLYDEYGGRLLESNVRSFLSTGRAVNKQIRGTIRATPELFFAYNNGIAATASALDIKVVSGTPYIVRATDLQIVNGGQTTASLSNARFKDNADLGQVAVQMKLTMVEEKDAEKEADLIRNISRSSNSQSKVSEADFAALNPFHIRMEKISRRLFAPAADSAQHGTKWFYERAAGEYLQLQMRMTPRERNAFVREYPKAQKITKIDLAKAHNAWDRKPHILSKGAQANFADFNRSVTSAWEKDDQRFNDQYFQDSVALRILFRETEKLVSQQPWYTGGYRANIVAYAIALLHDRILGQYTDQDLDLRLIWNEQSVPSELLSVIADVAEEVFEHITSDSRPVENITQWCKRERCWTSLNSKNVRLGKDVEVFLISSAEAKSVARDARADQKIVSDVDAQSEVLHHPRDVWRRLDQFAKAEKILRAGDPVVFRQASLIPNSIPTGKQCRRLLSILNEAVTLGFVV